MDYRKNAYNKDVAVNYEFDREKENHWKLENDFIENYFKNNTKVKSLLDIPVGTGRFFFSYSCIDNVTGIDVSNDMLEEAKNKINNLELKNINLKLGNAFKLDCRDSSFEYTVCFRLMHLMPPESRIELLSELMRVTSEKILLQVYEEREVRFLEAILIKMTAFYNKFFLLMNCINKEPWSHIAAYQLNKEELKNITEKIGLQIVEEVFLCVYKGHTNVKVYVLSKKS